MDHQEQARNAVSNNSSRECPSDATDGMYRRDAKVSASYMEIYNESVNDLLNSNKKNLEIRENKDGGVLVD